MVLEYLSSLIIALVTGGIILLFLKRNSQTEAIKNKNQIIELEKDLAVKEQEIINLNQKILDTKKSKEEAQHDFKVKRLEMMLAKVQTQRSLCKVSVLSASVEANGFWFNQAEIMPTIIEEAIKSQIFDEIFKNPIFGLFRPIFLSRMP